MNPTGIEKNWKSAQRVNIDSHIHLGVAFEAERGQRANNVVATTLYFKLIFREYTLQNFVIQVFWTQLGPWTLDLGNVLSWKYDIHIAVNKFLEKLSTSNVRFTL